MFANLNIPWKKSKALLKGEKVKNVNTAIHSMKCNHDWQFVQDRKFFDTKLQITETHAFAYCPLCKTSQLFTRDDWEAIQKIQEIEKKYKR